MAIAAKQEYISSVKGFIDFVASLPELHPDIYGSSTPTGQQYVQKRLATLYRTLQEAEAPKEVTSKDDRKEEFDGEA